MKTLLSKAIQTKIFKVGESLIPFAKESVEASIDDTSKMEGSILAITSKILSLSESRIVVKENIDKESLVRRESEYFLGEIGYGCFLTIKHGLFIASAGIDESNAEGEFYILYPEDPFKSAFEIRNELAKAWGLKRFGVIITDSHTSPLRAGVTGVALAHAGFRGVQSKIGSPDLFGNPLKMTQINVADALAVAAVYCMGETDEACPLALLRTNVDFVSTNDINVAKKECRISVEKDLYSPLFAKKLI